MSSEAQIVFMVLGLTALMFTTELLALDLIAVLAVLALYFLGILSPEEVLSGFSNPIVVTLAALFVLGGALFKTGVAARLGERLASREGASQSGLVAKIMLTSALLSAFMSSTGTAAILIPAIVGLAKKRKASPSIFLMPLAYGCLIGGMLTLVGTPPNLVVQEALIDHGYPAFNFLSFAPMGLAALLIGVVYMCTLGSRLLPAAPVQEETPLGNVSTRELAQDYELGKTIFRLQVPPDSKLLGLKLSETHLRDKHEVNVVGVQRDNEGSPLEEVGADYSLEAGHIIHVHSRLEPLTQTVQEEGLTLLPPIQDYSRLAQGSGVAEILLTPRSRLIGKTLRSSCFQARYRVNVIELKRQGKLLEDKSETRLKFGDTLLVVGRHSALEGLWSERDSFVVTGMPEESHTAGFRPEKAWIAIALAILMLVLITFDVLPTVMVVLAVAAIAVVVGCLSSEDAYRSISWQSLILIACMLPMADALQKTGGVDYLASALAEHLGHLGPHFLLAGLFLLTSLFSQVISNTATTVILAPIALEAASQIGVAPQAFLMAVAVAASCAFATPVASTVNMLILTPGRYRFVDFLKVGLPLQVLMLGAATILLPLLFPWV